MTAAERGHDVALAVVARGSLGAIVEAAPLTFLGTFAVVNWIAARHLDGSTVLAWVGVAGCAAATAILALRVWSEAPMALGAVVVVAALALGARRPLLDRVRTA